MNYYLIPVILAIVAAMSVGNVLAITYTENVVADRTGADTLIKAESDGGSSIFRLVDTGNRVFDIQLLDGLGRFDFVDRTSGDVRMSFTSVGNVGVGTALPSVKLEVVDETSEIKVRSKTGPAILSADAFGGDARIALKDAGIGSFAIQMPDGTGKLEIKDTLANQVRMSIAPNGDICLGTGC